MTREEAAKICQSIKFLMDKEDYSEEVEEALNMAIAALKQLSLPKIIIRQGEQEPCEDKRTDKRTETHACDCISRQAAIDEMGYCQTFLFDTRDKDKKISLEDVLYALEQLPSAQPFTEEQIQTMQELESAQVEKAYELGTKEKIIRCMDCKYLQKWRSEESAKKFGQTYECARNVLDCPTLEDFCSHAERRTDE